MADEGFVYVIQMEGHPIYKIGFSNNVPRRMSEIGVQLPFHYKLCFAHRVSVAHYHEARLHREFAAFRRNGEWFELSLAALSHIQANLLYIQAEALTDRIINQFSEVDHYPSELIRYGRIFARVGRRNDRRLGATVGCRRNWKDEYRGTDVVIAERVV